MKIQIIKQVYTSQGWRNEGAIFELDPKTARHYIKKGIGVEYKEEKGEKETKELKPKRKYTKRKK